MCVVVQFGLLIQLTIVLPSTMLASTTSVVSNLQKSANNNKSSEKNIGGHAANNTSGDTNHLHNKQWKETKIDYVLKVEYCLFC